MNKFIPLSIPNFEGNEKKYVESAIEQGWVSTGGPYIEQLEQNLADFLSTEKVAAVQSGTAALHLSLVEAGVKSGDVVIVPTLTFIAAVNPVKYLNASPVFMDCDDSLCMDPIKLREFCECECVFEDNVLWYQGKCVKALVVVHIFGNMADMVSIMEIAEKYNLKVIEDATEALGTYYIDGTFKGKYAGTIGDFGAYSFNGNKIITTGGGGALTARTSNVVEHIKYLSTQAKDDSHFYIHHEIGFNYRMTNVQAAIGVAQVEELPEFIRRKNSNFEMYKQLFEGFELAKLIEFRQDILSNKWFYALAINRNRIEESMKTIISKLEERGIQTRAIWGLIHEQKPYRADVAYKIEKAPYYVERILNIPSSTQITEDEVIYVAEQIKQVLTELDNNKEEV